MKAIRRFTVRTVLPGELAALDELAGNLRWSWHEPTRELFEHISPQLWEVNNDPVALLGAVDPERLDALAGDRSFVERAEELRDDLRRYISEPRWYQGVTDAPSSIAYFSPEFGIAAALPQYSGGLGILAGDHLKAASDLGVPLLGVGLFYRSGYFTQSISADGWQQEAYPVLDPDGLPLNVLRGADGAPVQVALALPTGTLFARIWQADVGRVKLLLLDTDIPENAEALRGVTDRLYGGGGEHRLLQELLLGIGGVRAIKAYLDLTGARFPKVFHTNEGHAGFLGLERISDLVAGGGLTFDEALQVVRAGTVFTTHTPVPAGIDRFDRDLVETYFSADLLPGVDAPDVLPLGIEDHEGDDSGMFNMAVMGLRLSQHANGVSKLHGKVSRGMFAGLWPGFDDDDVPITSVTNGVHAPTWTDPMLQRLAAERLGNADTTQAAWAADALSDGDLWDVRRAMREQLVGDARARVQRSWQAQNPGSVVPSWMNEILDPDVLTIGFARRVPTYKRLTLMLHDENRLRAILTSKKRPVQLIIAGKSHPADDEGKRLIQKLVQFTSDPEVRRRIVFLPNYDIGMAQKLYPGTDVWLNNPLRPFEACGTSGMKAALNGALNLSILDGWWDEFFDGENGWAIPSSDASGDTAQRDALEAGAMYDLIEHQVAPRFYERDKDGVPKRWMRSVRHTLASLSPKLSADRMVREYVEKLYTPAGRAASLISEDDYVGGRELAEWKVRVRGAWAGVQVLHVESEGLAAVPRIGDELRVRAQVHLGGLAEEDVSVEVVYGTSREGDALENTTHVALSPLVASAPESARYGEGVITFAGSVTLTSPGSFGYNVRVVPRNPALASSAELGLIAVAS